MSELVCEDPPASGSTVRLCVRYADELAKVRTQPGEWFRLLDYPGNPSSAHRSATALRGQTTGFEFRVAQGRVYVRWIGTEAEA